MSRKILLLAALCLGLSTAAQADDGVQALLKKADAFRLTEDHLQVENQIIVKKNGQIDKDRLYSVILAGTKKSLVLMRSPAEKGQKVLMLGDDYWLIMPSSQRPMRITPTQKLLGDASTGDIATLSWAGDYDGKIVGEEPCEEGGKERCTHLSLVSQRKGLTYAHIELWLAVGSAEPARADLYVQSDKLAKRAKFILDKIDGRRMVRDMVIFDQIEKSRETTVRYLSRKARQAPDEWFNPMYLTRAEIE
ncbi:MAG: hypothetical protein RJA63_1046 [Pseudomonadota bacterium]|jgi:hypothetical protein